MGCTDLVSVGQHETLLFCMMTSKMFCNLYTMKEYNFLREDQLGWGGGVVCIKLLDTFCLRLETKRTIPAFYEIPCNVRDVSVRVVSLIRSQ